MGLSKMQHGLHVQTREVAPGFERVIIDVDLLLETILLYCIQDQEWASYVSYSSRQADVILVVYEDVLSRPEIVLKSMQPWFSVPLRKCCTTVAHLVKAPSARLMTMLLGACRN